MAAANAEEVGFVCSQLVRAVEIMVSPQATREERAQAFEKCEEFKRTSPLSIQCGLALAQNSSNAPIVRHFGLKILEDVIKMRWYNMSHEEKVFVKESAMRMVEAGDAAVTHIKDGVARLVVEIIKREFPQQWPGLWSELGALCTRGESQTEMVMLLILRLVEDVVLFQSLEQNQRRKEIYQALTANMEEIFAFMLKLLEKHYQAHLAGAGAERHRKVCQAILDTFSAFVEWVPITHIMANNRYLVRVLCHLLSDDTLQSHAAECLLNIVMWKAGKVTDRQQLLSLFETDMMAPLFAAAERANQRALDENHYTFLKKMVQVLAELGVQLSSLWTKGKRPENFDVYLNALLAFAGHPSQMVNHYVNELWNKFFRHADISSDEIFRSYIPKWVEVSIRKCVRVGFPSREDHPSCAYSALDHDTDEEFLAFFGKYRIIITEGLKTVSAESPAFPFHCAEQWLRQVLSTSPVMSSDGASSSSLQLEAVALVFDAILYRQSASNLESMAAGAKMLTALCLEYATVEPNIMSSLLSCISALFAVVGASQAQSDAVMRVLTQVFHCISFTKNQPLGKQEADVKSLRRHGCALLVKMATRQPKTLLAYFEHLHSTVMTMRGQNLLAQAEFSTLVEALVIVSNEFASINAQAAFIKSIATPVSAKLNGLEPSLSSAQAFMRFVGLTEAAAASPDNDPLYFNRSDITFCLNFILAVCRRSSYPPDIELCRKGGFVLSESGDGHVVLRSASWEVAASVLGTLFKLAKSLNDMWLPENVRTLSPDFAKVLEMLTSEKNSICGVGNRESNRELRTRTPLTRMQTFLFETYENLYHMLSQLCSSCGYDFYRQPGLADGLLTWPFSGLAGVPDFRLRVVNRVFVKALVNKCPKSGFVDVLAPVLKVYCPFMLERLTERWKYLAGVRESPGFDEDNTDDVEVINDVVCRHLAREYLDVVKALLTSGGGSDVAIASLAATVGSSQSESNEDEAGATSTPTAAQTKHTDKIHLSELGLLLLQQYHDSIGHCLVMTLLGAILWPDSPSSVRACGLLELVLPVLVQRGQLSSADASHVMVCILKAIHELGQHELNNIALTQLALMAYEVMRPHHPAIVDVLAQVPGCQQEDLKRFDDKMVAGIVAVGNGTAATGGDRTKKDMFRKLIGQFIGKDVAKMFKNNEVVIKNLPTLQLLKPRLKTPSLDETERHDIGLGALFSPPQANGHAK